MVTWADVIAVAPELGTVSETAQAAILAQVAVQFNADAWGDRLAIGQVYLAAHLGSLRGGPGYARETVDSHQREVQGDLEATAYGREYRRLMRSLGSCQATLAGGV